MKHFPAFLLLLFVTAARLSAQGICDSTISISPIPPVCAGTGLVYLTASHPGGLFSEPTLGSSFSYLNAQYLHAGTHTLSYTITGPGGCTVTATRDFEVLDAPEVFAWVSGKIDCAAPNSEVNLMAFPPPNYGWDHWKGPNGQQYFDQSATVGYAGTYRYTAYSATPSQCPAYANVEVGYVNNQVPIKIEDCTDCSGWAQKIRVTMVPANWQTTVVSPNGGGYYSPADPTGCFAALHGTGLWKVQATNPANGCKATVTQYLDTEHPIPSVNAGSNVSIWCNGAGKFLPAMIPQSGSLFHYFWTTPNGSTFPATYGGLLQATDPGAYVLHGVNTFTGCEDLDTAYAGVASLPLSTQIAVVCDGESLYGHTQTGTYTDTLLQANGCEKVQTTKLIVLAPLLDSVEVTPDNGLMNGSIQHYVTQGWPPYSYYWITGETSPSILNLSAGTYTVTVTDANDCHHIREIVVPSGKPSRPLGADRNAASILRARLYPNPVAAGRSECTLEIVSGETGPATLLLNDVLGRTVFARDMLVSEGKNVFSISENLPEGVYTVLLKGGFGRQEVLKLVSTGGE